jgi:hypothetical protein
MPSRRWIDVARALVTVGMRSLRGAKTRRRLNRFRRRFEKVTSFLRDLLGHYEEEEADWRALSLSWLVRGAPATLEKAVLGA